MTTAVAPGRVSRVRSALSLIWYGRLSWMRIILALIYGTNTFIVVRLWHIDLPDREYHGWIFALIPPGLRDSLIGTPNLIAGAVVLAVGMIVVGFGTRPALFALAVMGLFVRAVEGSRGVFDHESSLTTQVLIVLAFAPGTNAISLEHLIRWWRAGRTDLLGYLTRPYRQWGVYLILGLLAITYTTSGLSKLRFSEFRWMDGETLGFYLRGLTASDTVYLVGGGGSTWRDDFGLEMYTYGNYNFGSYSTQAMTSFVDWFAHNALLMALFSIATVLLELAGFLLFVPRLRSVLLIGYICMHTSIGLLMGLPFVEYQVVCLLLIEWERIFGFIERRMDARRAAREGPVATAGPALAAATPPTERAEDR